MFLRLLELAVAHEPVRYRGLVANSKAKLVPPTPPPAEVIRQAWTVHEYEDHGGSREQASPVRWICLS